MVQKNDIINRYNYIGTELEIFELANNWKRYLSTRLHPYISGDILEVGAGFGTNIPYLYRSDLTRWISLEPDPELCKKYHERQLQGLIPGNCELVQGQLRTLSASETFDSIIYIDVLEHIEDDRKEFSMAFNRLRPGGHLSIICPALNILFSPFDEAIGHFRRYNKQLYLRLSDRTPLKIEYLDTCGFIASLSNKILLRQSYPSAKQIKIWDNLFVMLSRIVDPLTFRKTGRAIVGIWKNGDH